MAVSEIKFPILKKKSPIWLSEYVRRLLHYTRSKPMSWLLLIDEIRWL
jgi:hypothetical protein